ncbi:MAG: hypothetical protein HY925_15080 [Elusimicrobia bacterium]|nr:hypothetical protein [Elusimicrobiota bacterium]
MAFDGMPLEEAHLEDPYRGLFEEESEEKGLRSLAAGLLSVLRLSPTEVYVASGQGGRRGALRINTSGRDSAAAPEPETRTVIRVSWKRWVIPEVDAYIESARDGFGLASTELWLEGKRLRSDSRKTISGENGRIRATISTTEDIEPGSVALYKDGALVEVADWSGHPSIRAELSSEDFVLDASRATVVRNKAYQKAMAVLEREAESIRRRPARRSAIAPGQTAAESIRRAWNDDETWRLLAAWNLAVGLTWLWLSTPYGFGPAFGEQAVFTSPGEQAAMLALFGAALAGCSIRWHLARGRHLRQDTMPAALSSGLAPLLILGLLAAYYQIETRVTTASEAVVFAFPWPKSVEVGKRDIASIHVTRSQSKDSDDNKVKNTYNLRVETSDPALEFSRSQGSSYRIVEAARLLSNATGKSIDWYFDPISGGQRPSNEAEASAAD